MEDILKLLISSAEDLNWFKENSENIKEEYEGEIIAIYNKKIVARAPTSDIMFKKLKEKKINDSEVLIKTISPKDQIIIL